MLLAPVVFIFFFNVFNSIDLSFKLKKKGSPKVGYLWPLKEEVKKIKIKLKKASTILCGYL